MGRIEDAEARYLEIVKSRFGGALCSGKGLAREGRACVLQLESVARGLPWSDDPALVRCFDLRPLNDMDASGGLRARKMSALLARYSGSLDWPRGARRAVLRSALLDLLRRCDRSGVTFHHRASPGEKDGVREVFPEWKGDRGLPLSVFEAVLRFKEWSRNGPAGGAARPRVSTYVAWATAWSMRVLAAERAPEATPDDVFLEACAVWERAFLEAGPQIDKGETNAENERR